MFCISKHSLHQKTDFCDGEILIFGDLKILKHTIAHKQERAAAISHITTATYSELFMESAKSRAIFAALLRLLLDCSRQCLGSMKHTEKGNAT